MLNLIQHLFYTEIRIKFGMTSVNYTTFYAFVKIFIQHFLNRPVNRKPAAFYVRRRPIFWPRRHVNFVPGSTETALIFPSLVSFKSRRLSRSPDCSKIGDAFAFGFV